MFNVCNIEYFVKIIYFLKNKFIVNMDIYTYKYKTKKFVICVFFNQGKSELFCIMEWMIYNGANIKSIGWKRIKYLKIKGSIQFKGFRVEKYLKGYRIIKLI